LIQFLCEEKQILAGFAKFWSYFAAWKYSLIILAELSIFRFLMLPIELRFKVYDLTIISDKGLSFGSYEYGSERILAGIQLTATCRQIYEETRSLFWRNNFKISDFNKQTKLLVPLLTENLREVMFGWWAFKLKDPQILRMLKDCKKLKILHLRLTKWSILSDNDSSNPRRQYLHQDEPAVAKFKRTNGFDDLLSLRGLELVTVKNDYEDRARLKPEALSDEELKAFESFLSKQLTQPKSPKVCVNVILRESLFHSVRY